MPKAQHAPGYRSLPKLLQKMREDAGLTQRQLGAELRKPQSWIYNCETANRRVDIHEFTAWCTACGVKPEAGFKKFLAAAGL